MTVFELGLGVSLAIVCIWTAVLYLLQMVKIEELEAEIKGCRKEVKMQRESDEVELAPEALAEVLAIKIAILEDFLPTVDGMSHCKAEGKLKRLKKELNTLYGTYGRKT